MPRTAEKLLRNLRRGPDSRVVEQDGECASADTLLGKQAVAGKGSEMGLVLCQVGNADRLKLGEPG